MLNNKRKGVLFNILKQKFSISLFYKPTLEGNDLYYYAILNNTIFIKMRIYDNDILIIHETYPITNEYVLNIYEELLDILMQQSKFTVLISQIGFISNLKDACLNKNLPTIEDERFIDIPKNLYSQMRSYFSEDISKFGFFILNVVENVVNEEDEDIEDLSIKEIFEIHIFKDDYKVINEIKDNSIFVYEEEMNSNNIKSIFYSNYNSVRYMYKNMYLNVDFISEGLLVISSIEFANSSASFIDFIDLIKKMKDNIFLSKIRVAITNLSEQFETLLINLSIKKTKFIKSNNRYKNTYGFIIE